MTGKDYKQHICDSINNLAKIGSLTSVLRCDVSLKQRLSKIKCWFTDRASVKHLTIFLLHKECQIQIVELNFNLHPVEVGFSKTRKDIERRNTHSGNASDCLALRIITAMNSLRYSAN